MKITENQKRSIDKVLKLHCDDCWSNQEWGCIDLNQGHPEKCINYCAVKTILYSQICKDNADIEFLRKYFINKFNIWTENNLRKYL